MAKFVDIVTRIVKGTPLSYIEMDTNLTRLQKASAPLGTIVIYTAEFDLPDTWLECNGASLDATTYAGLYSVLGNVYGGDAANFNIPDLRGYFVRGYHSGSGTDPDYATRNFGAFQWDELASHRHEFDNNNSVVDSVHEIQKESGSNPTQTKTTYVGGAETRPRNLTFYYIMKASED